MQDLSISRGGLNYRVVQDCLFQVVLLPHPHSLHNSQPLRYPPLRDISHHAIMTQYYIINMSQEAYKHALRLFSLIVVIVGVYQTYRFQSQDLLAYAAQNNSTNTSSTDPNSNSTTPSVNSSSQYNSGVSLFATAQAQTFVKQSLTRRGLTPIIKTYTLTGIEWVFNAALTYGHFVVAMYIYSAFKNPQNPQGKKLKIVGIGLVVLFAWIYFSGKIGYEKIRVVDSNGRELYHSERAEDKKRFEVFLNEGDNHELFLTTNESTGASEQATTATSSTTEQQGEEYVERRGDEDVEVKLDQLESGL